MKQQIQIGIVALTALIALTAAYAQGNMRTSFTLAWDAGSQIEGIDLFKVYTRTNLDGVTLTETNFRHTYVPGTNIPPASEWTLWAELKPADLVRTNVVQQRLDGTLATNLSFTLPIEIEPGIHFFAVTSSNFWGESDFFEVVGTPEPPNPNKNVRAY